MHAAYAAQTSMHQSSPCEGLGSLVQFGADSDHVDSMSRATSWQVSPVPSHQAYAKARACLSAHLF